MKESRGKDKVMKQNRHDKILELISEHDIETQDELIRRLREFGFEATQATISRDIKKLKLIKVAGTGGQYKYAVSPESDGKSSAKYQNIIKETIVHMDFAENLVVLKTYPGMAQAAAAAIDAQKITGVVGSVAGDDTILVVMRSREFAEEFCKNNRMI